MNDMRFTPRNVIGLAIAVMCVMPVGCGPSALSSGTAIPTIKAEGWINGDPPGDLRGNVVVLEVFATW